MHEKAGALLLLSIATLLAAPGCRAARGREQGQLGERDRPLASRAQGAAGGPLTERPKHALVGWAALPHGARSEGPSSGHFIRGENGVVPPFQGQPVPGWSGLLEERDGRLLALPDNGFGRKGNSADFVLGYYTIHPALKTRGDGTSAPGVVVNERFVAFHDARGLLRDGLGVDLTITADRDAYYAGEGAGTDSGIEVDRTIRERRLLTGYDFDVEAIARAEDGTLWVGDEFGPFLLHFGRDGTLLEDPVPHPFLKSPMHPDVLAARATPTLAGSRGFESLAFDAERRLLYVVAEAAPLAALRPMPGDERVLEIFEFDPTLRAYTGRTFRYRKDGAADQNEVLIGDMANVGPDLYVLIERDSAYGDDAKLKRLYLVNLSATERDGTLKKRLLIDLLGIDDPRDIGGELPGLAPHKFSMPFDSVESVVSLGTHAIGVAVDTNYPTQDARQRGVPDATEFIVLRFERPIASYAPRAPSHE